MPPMPDAPAKPLIDAVAAAVDALATRWEVPLEARPTIALERPRDPLHGDYSTNVAMQLARPLKRPPREIATGLIEELGATPGVTRVEIAGPGFINFFLEPSAQLGVVRAVLDAPETYGNGELDGDVSVHIEFCSANPTGPLHVGHGRGAAYGMALSNVMEASGYLVHREYYVNDAGRQIDILAASTWLRALVDAGAPVAFPAKGYRGAYIADLARGVEGLDGHVPAPEDVPGATDDDEALLDAWIACCAKTLGDTGYRQLTAYVVESIRTGIETDLAAFGVTYDNWFSERGLFESGLVEEVVAHLEQSGHLYEKGGAKWFRATRFGDEKDRVVVRDNGVPTYFASDIAYHFDKYRRGYDHVIDVWGADHHGYVPRVVGALTALELDPSRFEVLLVQFATLSRGGEKVQMSTRSGQFVELAELVAEVGADAARYFYVTRKSEQHLEFDLELAKEQSKDNPVYYIQYAHARIASVRREVSERGLDGDPAATPLERLTSEREIELTKELGRFPEVVRQAAERREPHQVANFLRDLAHQFHSYYNDTRILVDDAELRAARLALCRACQIVFARGLTMLGVAAPERM